MLVPLRRRNSAANQAPVAHRNDALPGILAHNLTQNTHGTHIHIAFGLYLRIVAVGGAPLGNGNIHTLGGTIITFHQVRVGFTDRKPEILAHKLRGFIGSRQR